MFSQRSLTLDLGTQKVLRWTSIVADVQMPIIGIDFLRQSDLLVDTKRHRLVDNSSKKIVSRILANTVLICPMQFQLPSFRYSYLLDKFPTLLQSSIIRLAVISATQDFIVTNGSPVYARARRLTPDKLETASAEFEHMFELGIIWPFNSPWASLIHLVPKKS